MLKQTVPALLPIWPATRETWEPQMASPLYDAPMTVASEPGLAQQSG